MEINNNEKSKGPIGNRTHDLSVRSVAPQPTGLPRIPLVLKYFNMLSQLSSGVFEENYETVSLIRFYWVDRADEVGGTYGTYGRRKIRTEFL